MDTEAADTGARMTAMNITPHPSLISPLSRRGDVSKGEGSTMYPGEASSGRARWSATVPMGVMPRCCLTAQPGNQRARPSGHVTHRRP